MRENAEELKRVRLSLRDALVERETVTSKLKTANVLRSTVCRVPGFGPWLKMKLTDDSQVEAAEKECARLEKEYSQIVSSGKQDVDSPEVRSIRMAELLSARVLENEHAWAIMGANHVDQVRDELLKRGWQIWSPKPN